VQIFQLFTKKGKKNDPGNYGSISLTCIICKILEFIIRDRIMEYCVQNSLFSNKQFGFLKECSTVTQLDSYYKFKMTVLKSLSRVVE